jgi:methylglyoxal/glyoxal reductase
MTTTMKTARVTLNNGVELPQVGLGVWQAARGRETQDAIRWALARGYRHIDTARVYRNEEDVGEAVRRAELAREQVFITTKLWNDDQGFDSTLRAFEQSLKRLGLDYIDLYLIHWPVAKRRLESWEALERLYEEKRVRAIGVSNFLVPHLRELLDHAEVVPQVNQIELSPFLQRRDTLAFCKQHGIAVEAYSPLTRGQRLSHKVVLDVARRAQRTPAQVLLRWGLQKDAIVLPKSTHEARIAENAALFDFTLDAFAMQQLDALEENLTTGWDPASQA